MSRRPQHHNPKAQAGERATPLLYGMHAVRQAWLNPERTCRKLLLTENGMEEFAPILAEAKHMGLTRPAPLQADRDHLDRLLPGAVHQGIVLDAADLPESDLGDIFRAAEGLQNACIMVLDQVTDPHNVGAIMRSCAAFGALALVIQDRNAPQLTGVLAKTACGAADVVPLIRVGNLARAIDEIRAAGFWTVGLAEEGKSLLSEVDMTGKIALVMGAEGDGMRRLTMERCDIIARLPTLPPIGSLNVSNAAAVSLYEVTRRAGPAAA